MKRTREELKANATRALRQLQSPLANEKIWAKGGDIELIEEDDLEQVLLYVSEAQERKGLGEEEMI